ncbi:MAG: tetratricopeptide repeat protein [Anaerolineales bacterium]
MSETASPKRALIYWDEQHTLSLLCEPEVLLGEQPWRSWIERQGGLAAVYDSLLKIPLSEKQHKTIQAILSEPGASLQRYALTLHVSVATYVRYRASLVKTLAAVLNTRLWDQQPVADDRGGKPARFNELPYQNVPLIGRERELETIRQVLLRDEVKLLTITGPGGIGKTRLALQAATELLDKFEDGVFFAPLASITDPDLVAVTILQTLGFVTGENLQAAGMLQGYLQDKHLLLLIDNFEQVTAAAPLLGELLEAAPRLKILVTSQAVLHIYDEHEFNAPPLAVPDIDHLPALDVVAQSPAVALFVNRAEAVRADFALTPENVRFVVEICAQLDGIPLALELAAARIKSFAPQALLRELSHRLNLLAQKSPDRALRHQTLRNAVDWSYQLLAPDERALFAQLGVFVGGCTLNAVEAVCAVGGDRADVSLLEELASLVDKSMLQHEFRSNGEMRFMLPETLREFALERLGADGLLDAARRRHLAFYLAFVETLEPGTKNPNLPAWMKDLEEEHDNLRAALQWALENNEVESALRIAGSIWRFWQIHGHVEEGAKSMSAILGRAEKRESPARAKALWGAGWLGMVMGTLAQSREYFEEGAAISRALQDDHYLGLSLHGLGAVARAQGDFDGSSVAFKESLPLFQSLQDTENVAWTFEHLGVTAIERGDFVQAGGYLTQGLALFRELDQRWPCAEALTFLGHAALRQGNCVLAQKRYEDALSIYDELEDRLNIAITNSYIGATLFGQGEYKKAVSLYKESLLLSHGLKDHWGFAWGLERLAEAAEKLGQPEQSARLWGAADALRRTSGILWHLGFHSYYTERRFAALRATLGQARWEELWLDGQGLPAEKVVAIALGV